MCVAYRGNMTGGVRGGMSVGLRPPVPFSPPLKRTPPKPSHEPLAPNTFVTLV